MRLTWPSRLSYGVVLTVLAVVSISVGFLRVNRAVPLYVRVPTYARVDIWLESAECSAKTGSFLTVCRDGRLLPIEDASFADDRGHSFLLNLWSYFRTTRLTRADLVRLNWAINCGGFLLLAWLLFQCGLKWPAAVSVLLIFPYGIPRWITSFDVIGAFPGILALTLCPALILVVMLRNQIRPKWLRLAATAAGSTAAPLAMLLRESIGILGVVTFFAVATIWGLLMERASLRSVWILVLTLSVVLSLFSTRLLLEARNLLFDVPPASGNAGHGFSHNLYIGLGVYPNPWGIKWDDASAEAAVKRVDPNVRYCSPEYFQILRREYRLIVQSDPSEVFRIYARKLRDVLSLHVGGISPIPYSLTIAVIVLLGGMWAAGRWHRLTVDPFPLLVLALLWTGLILQGVLALPAYFYVYPAEILQILLLTLLVEWTGQWLGLWTPSAPHDTTALAQGRGGGARTGPSFPPRGLADAIMKTGTSLVGEDDERPARAMP